MIDLAACANAFVIVFVVDEQDEADDDDDDDVLEADEDNEGCLMHNDVLRELFALTNFSCKFKAHA